MRNKNKKHSVKRSKPYSKSFHRLSVYQLSKFNLYSLSIYSYLSELSSTKGDCNHAA